MVLVPLGMTVAGFGTSSSQPTLTIFPNTHNATRDVP